MLKNVEKECGNSKRERERQREEDVGMDMSFCSRPSGEGIMRLVNKERKKARKRNGIEKVCWSVCVCQDKCMCV